MSPEMLDWVIKLGFPAALALFFVWENRKAQMLLVQRLQTSEDWIRETLVKMNNKSSDALRENAAALREAASSNRKVLEALNARPCLMEQGEYKQPAIPVPPALETTRYYRKP